MGRSMLRAGYVAAAGVVCASVAAIVAGGAARSAPTLLGVAGRANAHVSLAARDRFVVAVWFASTQAGPGDVFAAVSRDAGASFGSPVRVNSTPGAARINGEQPPRVSLVPTASSDPAIAVVWTAKSETGTMLLSSRSTDGGRSFAASLPIPGTESAGNRGWQAIASGQGGAVYAAWLDHRRLAPPATASATAGHKSPAGTAVPAGHEDHADHAGHAGHGGHEGHAAASRGMTDGVAMAQQSDLYFGVLGASAPRAVTSGVCYCCKTAVAVGANGEIFLAWRHVFPGNFRDIAFTVSRDGGASFAPPVRVSQDNWMLTGCPDDGPSMQVDAAGRIHVVWPAVVNEPTGPVKALFHAWSADARRFSTRVRLPTMGQANHPHLAAAADGLRVAWDESGDGSRRVALSRGVIDGEGRTRFARMSLGGEIGVYPNVAATTAGPIVAWTSGPPDRSVIKVARDGSE